jgi:hypothetical protein
MNEHDSTVLSKFVLRQSQNLGWVFQVQRAPTQFPRHQPNFPVTNPEDFALNAMKSKARHQQSPRQRGLRVTSARGRTAGNRPHGKLHSP